MNRNELDKREDRQPSSTPKHPKKEEKIKTMKNKKKRRILEQNNGTQRKNILSPLCSYLNYIFSHSHFTHLRPAMNEMKVYESIFGCCFFTRKEKNTETLARDS